jgi:hypothetical protein
LTSLRDDRQRVRDYVVPAMGQLAMRAVGKADVRAMVSMLDDKVRAGDLAWKTVAHVWTIVRTMFRDLAPRRASLVVRDDDPTENVEGPDRGDDRARTCL